MVIHQGDVFWAALGEPRGSEPGCLRPVLVVQSDRFNLTNINTVVVCVLTTNLARARAPGNVLLPKGEANLPRRSVVNVSQLFTVDKGSFLRKIGIVSRARLWEVLGGIQLLLEPMEAV
jgi:mRNA interferase MazF